MVSFFSFSNLGNYVRIKIKNNIYLCLVIFLSYVSYCIHINKYRKNKNKTYFILE